MISEKYAIKVLQSVDYRRVKYQAINERVKALNLYELVKPSLNAINQEDIREKILKKREAPLEDYLKHHEISMIYLEKDIAKVSKAIDTISKVDSESATILYYLYFLHKNKTQIAEELNTNARKIGEIKKRAIKLFCKVY